MTESGLNAREILAHFDEERRTLGLAGYRLERTETVTRSIPLHDGWGWIAWSAHEPEDLDCAMDAEITHFQSLGCSFEWKVYDHDRPPDLRQRLSARGFRIGPVEAFLVLPTNDLAAPAAGTSGSCDVRRINTITEFEDFLAVEKVVWPENPIAMHANSRRRFLHHPDEVSYYVAYAGETPAACARVDFRPGSRFAGLFGGSTLDGFRGRGLYTALVAARGAEARERGVDFLFVDALPTSRPILERRGFQSLSQTYPCTWPVGGTGSPAA